MEEIIYDIESGEERSGEGRVESGEIMESGPSDRRSEGLPGGSGTETAGSDPVELESASGAADSVTVFNEEFEGADAESASGAAVRVTVLNEESEEADAENASGASVKMSAPHKEIERMVEEMGAETLLAIIKDNRNAAIRQIIREVEASRRRDLPSGNPVSASCSTIFDLAALA